MQSAVCIICSPMANKFHTCSLRGIFCQVHAPAENVSHFIRRILRRTLRGFFDKLRARCKTCPFLQYTEKPGQQPRFSFLRLFFVAKCTAGKLFPTHPLFASNHCACDDTLDRKCNRNLSLSSQFFSVALLSTGSITPRIHFIRRFLWKNMQHC